MGTQAKPHESALAEALKKSVSTNNDLVSQNKASQNDLCLPGNALMKLLINDLIIKDGL